MNAQSDRTEAIEAAARQIEREWYKHDLPVVWQNIAESILSLHWTCTNCDGSGEIQDRLAWDIPQAKEECPVCHGTGQGGLMFAVLSKNQEPPVIDLPEVVVSTQQLIRCIQIKMLTPKDRTVFVKVLVEDK